jgi:hypothetical protein
MTDILRAVILEISQGYGKSTALFWLYTWIGLGMILPSIVAAMIMASKGQSIILGISQGFVSSWIGVIKATRRRDFTAWKANLHAEQHSIIYEGESNHILGTEGIASIGGKLLLTDRALIFLSNDKRGETVVLGDLLGTSMFNRVSDDHGETVIPIGNISAVLPQKSLDFIPNRFCVRTKQGKEETFVIFHRDRWITQITEQMELAKTFSCTHAKAKVIKKKVETKIAERSEVNCSQSAAEKNNKCLRADRIRQDCRPAGGVGCQTVKYYYSNGRDQKGPVTLSELRLLAGLTRATLVWHAGLVSWTRAGDIPELSDAFASVASPVSPPVTVTRHHLDVKKM